jgi:hypothetical protein
VGISGLGESYYRGASVGISGLRGLKVPYYKGVLIIRPL